MWSDDRPTFDRIWDWTRQHLQVRRDRLFAWRWQGGKVTDPNSASDADVDIALALVLASRRFGADLYLDAARPIIRDIGRIDVAAFGGRYVLTAGNWTAKDDYPKVHVAYYAPYAYEEFARVDSTIPWREVVRTGYDLLHWLYFDLKPVAAAGPAHPRGERPARVVERRAEPCAGAHRRGRHQLGGRRRGRGGRRAEARLDGYALSLKASYLRQPTVDNRVEVVAGLARLF